MNRKVFLMLVSFVAFAIGFVTLFFPNEFVVIAKVAAPSETANVFVCTVGVLLISFSVLNFLVRNHENSKTLQSIFIANLILQLSLIPIDLMAYSAGTFTTLGSFVPNTILHIILASGFSYYLIRMRSDFQK